MSQLFQIFARPVTGQPATVFVFNGINQYVTIPPWIPLGLPFTVQDSFGVIALTGGIEQTVWRAGNAGPNEIISNSATHELRYHRINDGGFNTLIMSNPITLGTIITNLWTSQANGVTVDDGSVIAASSDVSLSITADGINTIAANGNGGGPFNGPIWNVSFTDNSPIQNTWVTMCDGVRFVTLAQSIIVPTTALFQAQFECIYGGDPLTGFIEFVGASDNISYARLYGSTHASFPNQIAVQGDEVGEFRYEVGDYFRVGQHFLFEIFNNATGVVSIRIDGRVLLNTFTPSNFGDVNLNTFCSAQAAGPLPTGWALHHFLLENQTNGDTWEYILDEETGDLTPNIGNTGGQTETQITYTTTLGLGWSQNTKDFTFDVPDGTVFSALNFGNLIVGQDYRITFDASGDLTPNVFFRPGNFNDDVLIDTAGSYDILFTAQNSNGTTRIANRDITGITQFKLDNLTIYEGRNYDGTWTDALGKVFIPDNSRFYPMDEGSGTVINDIIGGHDGTIVNGSDANWVSPSVGIDIDTIAPDGFTSGLPYTEDRLSVDDVGAIDHYHQGLPFTANGRVAVSFGVAIVRIGNGATPFDANGRIAMDVGGAVNYATGIPYHFDGHIVAEEAVVDTPITFDPIELSPNWTLLDGGPTSWEETSGVVTINATTAPEAGLAFGTLDVINVEITQTLEFVSAQPISSFLGAVRMTDSDNFIGWRSANGNIEVWQKIAGAFTNLGNVANPPVPSTVVFSAVEDQVGITVNGIDTNFTTTLLTSGRVGSVARVWDDGIQDVFSSFSADQTIAFDPIELSPNWSLISGPSSSWHSEFVADVETVSVAGQSANSSIAFGLLNVADVEVSSNIQYLGGGTGSASFSNAIRITDANNFIGWRSYQNQIQVYQRVAGAFTQFKTGGGNFPQATLGSNIVLRAVGSTVSIDINGTTYVADAATTILGAGRVGAIPRAWSVGARTLFDSFTATAI